MSPGIGGTLQFQLQMTFPETKEAQVEKACLGEKNNFMRLILF